MFQRMVGWGVIRRGRYLAIDIQEENTVAAVKNLKDWTSRQRFNLNERTSRFFQLSGHNFELEFELETVDVFDFLARGVEETYDLVVAHAFLDLFDISALMPWLVRLVKPGGGLYLTINFDGHTIFEPVWDAELEERIISTYHKTMDERTIGGKGAGDSKAGRHLFKVLHDNKLQIVASGSSDWVVYPDSGEYPEDEAYFLHHILHFFEESLENRPEVSPEELAGWLARRHEQVDRAELVYVAHQLDFLAHKPF
jgi:SAM-dependent methyltransferase